MTRLLEGIRVIDAANFIAGPVSTTIMADFGADVIKVEPPTGDVYRVRGAGYVPSPYNYPWIVDAWFETKEWVAWSPILEKTGVAFGVVATLDDVPHDAQMHASGALVPIDDPRAGATHTVSSPLHIGGHEKVPPTLAPEIGEHTVEVLRAAGITETEIARLLRVGVIVQA